MIDAGDQWDTYWASGKMNCYRDELALAYTPFAEKVSGKIIQKLNQCYEHDQAMSDANYALLDSIPRYELGKSACFETFAGKRIWGCIMDSLRRQDMLSRTARLDGQTIGTLDKPILVPEGRAFVDVVDSEVIEDVKHNLDFDDMNLFWHAIENKTGEKEIRRLFQLTSAELVKRMDRIRMTAAYVLWDSAPG